MTSTRLWLWEGRFDLPPPSKPTPGVGTGRQVASLAACSADVEETVEAVGLLHHLLLSRNRRRKVTGG